MTLNHNNEDDLSLRIGMLRQWLNEDRITDPEKMVTNEQILHWIGDAIQAHIDREVERYKNG